jgi:hypothetical protein
MNEIVRDGSGTDLARWYVEVEVKKWYYYVILMVKGFWENRFLIKVKHF